MYESVKNNRLDSPASGLVSRNTIVLMLMLQIILMAANDSKFYKGSLLEIQIVFKLFILYLRNDHNESILSWRLSRHCRDVHLEMGQTHSRSSLDDGYNVFRVL